jgi:hypothetical protein
MGRADGQAPVEGRERTIVEENRLDSGPRRSRREPGAGRSPRTHQRYARDAGGSGPRGARRPILSRVRRRRLGEPPSGCHCVRADCPAVAEHQGRLTADWNVVPAGGGSLVSVLRQPSQTSEAAAREMMGHLAFRGQLVDDHGQRLRGSMSHQRLRREAGAYAGASGKGCEPALSRRCGALRRGWRLRNHGVHHSCRGPLAETGSRGVEPLDWEREWPPSIEVHRFMRWLVLCVHSVLIGDWPGTIHVFQLRPYPLWRLGNVRTTRGGRHCRHSLPFRAIEEITLGSKRSGWMRPARDHDGNFRARVRSGTCEVGVIYHSAGGASVLVDQDLLSASRSGGRRDLLMCTSGSVGENRTDEGRPSWLRGSHEGSGDVEVLDRPRRGTRRPSTQQSHLDPIRKVPERNAVAGIASGCAGIIVQ